MRCSALNNTFRLKLTIPRASNPNRYYGLGQAYTNSNTSFALVFGSSDSGILSVYFKFNADVSSAEIKCSHENSTFEVIDEPSTQSWVNAAGVHNTL